MTEEISKIIEEAGYVRVESKNPYMISWIYPNDKTIRINYYFTSGTLTLQSPNNPIVTMKDVTVKEVADCFNL